MLLRARDRLSGGFGEAPADAELTLAQMAAWETYCVGRLERLGVAANQQRWRYNFRNRHGFHDRSDGAFDRLWASEGLTWGELDEVSRTASARRRLTRQASLDIPFEYPVSRTSSGIARAPCTRSAKLSPRRFISQQRQGES